MTAYEVEGVSYDMEFIMEMEVNPKKMKSKDQVESNKKKKQKEKKQKYETEMNELKPSCFSCQAHPNDYMRITPKNPKNPPNCKSCGFKLNGKFGYLTCPKSSSCFNICSTCKICTQNHILRQVVSLRQFKSNPLYAENKFSCHGCQKEREVGEGGVWHCSPCSFSVCPDCIERTAQLWEDLNTEDNDDPEE